MKSQGNYPTFPNASHNSALGVTREPPKVLTTLPFISSFKELSHFQKRFIRKQLPLTMPDPIHPVHPNSVQARLSLPACGILDGDQLAASWFDQTLSLRLGGAARFARQGDLAHHLRRSFGGALGAGASPECAATHPPSPCPWEPPCALDVFFREQLRVEGDGLPKPFVTLIHTDGADLIAGLRVFGFATDWIPTVEHAFTDALRHRLPWKKLGSTPPPVTDRVLETCEGLAMDTPPTAVALDWLTPLDAEKIDPVERAASVLTRLHRRLDGLARWHDSRLAPLDEGAVAYWQAMAQPTLTKRSILQVHARQAQRTDVAEGAMALHGDLAPFWAMLRLGERCFVGRGAARGQGRYRLRAEVV